MDQTHSKQHQPINKGNFIPSTIDPDDNNNNNKLEEGKTFSVHRGILLLE